MVKRIEVFFTNGNRSRFDADKVLFIDNISKKDIPQPGDTDLTLINWSAVSFVRPEKQHDYYNDEYD